MSNDYNLWRKRTYCYVLRNTDLFLFFLYFCIFFIFIFFAVVLRSFGGWFVFRKCTTEFFHFSLYL